MDEKPTRKLAAVWFADLVGYTALSSTDEVRALELVELLKDAAESAVRGRGGRVVKYLGDAAMAEFGSCEAAVEAALDLGTRFGDACRAAGLEAQLRVGAHLGELTQSPDGDIYGDVVNTAARLQAEAEPDQVLVSGEVQRQLRNRRAFLFTESGARSLRGKDEAVQTFVATRRYQRPPAREQVRRRDAMEESGRSLVVLPFQVLRPDPDLDFLAFGLPDAVSSSLMGLRSVVVRSSPSQPPDGSRLDPREVARVASADLVLAGAVQRAGDQVRVTAKLIDGRRGTLLWNETSTMRLGDLFELQDGLTTRIVESLAEPLTADERISLSRDIPSSGDAYELYLRANELSVAGHAWEKGIELYRAALEKDPAYAPAWARLGRCYRLLAKYGGASADREATRGRAEEAFLKALELNPDLALGQSLYAQFEVESGRPVGALIRLLRRAASHPNEVDLFVGLTHASRYCGLPEASLAAHGRARQLDPEARTSVAYSYLQTGDPDSALDAAPPNDPVVLYALQSMGRVGEMADGTESSHSLEVPPIFESFAETVLATHRGDLEGGLRHGRKAIDGFPDPEGRYFIARCWAALGADGEALDVLDSVVADGFCCVEGLRVDPLFEGLRDTPAFGALLERGDAAREAALEAFHQERGSEILPGVIGHT